MSSPFIKLGLSLSGLAGGLDVHEGDGDRRAAPLPPPRQAPYTLHRTISETATKTQLVKFTDGVEPATLSFATEYPPEITPL